MSGNVKQLDSIAEASDLLLKRRYLYTANFALNNAKKEIGPYLALSEIPDANVKYLDTIAKAMTPEVAKSKYGKMLRDYIVERKHKVDLVNSGGCQYWQPLFYFSASRRLICSAQNNR